MLGMTWIEMSLREEATIRNSTLDFTGCLFANRRFFPH